MQQLDESLRRLRTDRLDLWQVHECVYDNDPECHFARGGVIEALRRAAWERISPFYLSRLAGLVSSFEEAQSKELGSADAATVADAAVAGRVATVLVEADRAIPGRVDLETGRISFDDMKDPRVDDLLDDLAEPILARRSGDRRPSRGPADRQRPGRDLPPLIAANFSPRRRGFSPEMESRDWGKFHGLSLPRRQL